MSGKHVKRKPRAGVDEYGRAQLHYACLDGSATRVAELLSEGFDFDAQDNNGWTPLHVAAQSGCVDCLNMLLESGANVESRDSFGNTPLFRAVFSSKGRGDLIRALRDFGADPLARNDSGVSPLSLARTIGNYDVAQFFADLNDEP